MTYKDPSGLCPWCVAGLISGTISGIYAAATADPGQAGSAFLNAFLTGIVPPGISQSLINMVGNVAGQVMDPCFNGQINWNATATAGILGLTGVAGKAGNAALGLITKSALNPNSLLGVVPSTLAGNAVSSLAQQVTPQYQNTGSQP